MGIDHTSVLAYGVKVTVPPNTDDQEGYLDEIVRRYDLKLSIAGSYYRSDALEWVIGVNLGAVDRNRFKRVDLDSSPGWQRFQSGEYPSAAIRRLKKGEPQLNPEGPGWFLGLLMH